MKKLFPAAVCAAMIGWAGAAGALTIENGSFDTGLAGWQTSGAGAVSGVTSALNFDEEENFAPNGTPFAEIQATASLQQTGRSWSAGDQLTFDWAFLGFDEINTDSGENNDFAFFRVTDELGDEVFYDILTDIETVGSYGDSNWETYDYTFSSPGSGSIEFGVTNDGDQLIQFSSKLLIDDVSSISDAPGPGPAPIPEPTTMLLFGTGLLALAGFARRRGASKA